MKSAAITDDPETGDALDIYHTLMDAAATPDFDTHLYACILALSALDAQAEGMTWAEAAGYEDMDVLEAMFPTEAWHLADGLRGELRRSAEESNLVDLLWRGATRHDRYEAVLTQMVGRRAQRPNHLWQDLGLQNRGELTKLMQTHYTALASRNIHDMKWKKFFYRTMCSDADFTLCTAPSCKECADFSNCFGDESGLSLLAHARRKAEGAS